MTLAEFEYKIRATIATIHECEADDSTDPAVIDETEFHREKAVKEAHGLAETLRSFLNDKYSQELLANY